MKKVIFAWALLLGWAAAAAVGLFYGVTGLVEAQAATVKPAGCAAPPPEQRTWELVHECTYKMRVENGWLYNCFGPLNYTSVFVPDVRCFGGGN